MNRILLAVVTAALVAGAFGLAALQPAAAQPSAPVCVTLAPGEHEFTAPARDREGEVTFTVTVGEGGQVTEFIEPGGQSIPPSAMLQLFTGEDPYPLPEGVMIVECEGSDGDSMMEESAADVCLNLPAGVHETTVNVSGQSQPLVIDVGAGGVVRGVQVLGSTYTGAEGLALMEQFGVSLPPGVEIVPCAAPADAGAVYPTTGTGGLADSGSLGGLWAGLATLTVLAVAIAAAVQGRRVVVRNRRDR